MHAMTPTDHSAAIADAYAALAAIQKQSDHPITRAWAQLNAALAAAWGDTAASAPDPSTGIDLPPPPPTPTPTPAPAPAPTSPPTPTPSPSSTPSPASTSPPEPGFTHWLVDELPSSGSETPPPAPKALLPSWEKALAVASMHSPTPPSEGAGPAPWMEVHDGVVSVRRQHDGDATIFVTIYGPDGKRHEVALPVAERPDRYDAIRITLEPEEIAVVSIPAAGETVVIRPGE